MYETPSRVSMRVGGITAKETSRSEIDVTDTAGTRNEAECSLQHIRAVKATKSLKALSKNNNQSLLTPLRVIVLQERVPEISSVIVVYSSGWWFCQIQTASWEQLNGPCFNLYAELVLLSDRRNRKKHFNESGFIQISAVLKYCVLYMSYETNR